MDCPRTSVAAVIGACFLVLGFVPRASYLRGQEPAPATANTAPSDLTAFLTAKGYVAIPLKVTKSGHIDIDVKVKGEAMRFILDTGAGGTVIDAAVAKRLGLDIIKTDKLHAGVTGAKPLEKAVLEPINVGPIQSREEAVVADLSAVNAERKKDGDPVCDGLIGAGILQLFGAVIDYPSAKVFLMEPHAAALAIYDGRQLTRAETTVNRSFGAGRFTYGVIVKLQSEQPVVITKDAFAKLAVGMTYAEVADALGGGLANGRMAKEFSGSFAIAQGNRRVDLNFKDGKLAGKTAQGVE